MLINPYKFPAIVSLSFAIFCCASQHKAALAQFVPTDILITEAPIIDPEFDQGNARFTWVDGVGDVWIGNVDPQTGNFEPADGKSIAVDSGAVPVEVIGNGPEWVFTSSGPQIVYTKFDDGRYALGRARLQDGVWSGEILENGRGRFGPIGSLDRGDPSPRISYIGRDEDRKQVTFWRGLDEPSTEEAIPGSQPPGGRWVDGRRALVLTERVGSGRQGFMYDVDSGVLEQLTFDGGIKKAIFMWQAPEYGDEYLFFTLINEREIGVYRKIGGAWTKINTLKPPTSNDYLWSPELLVYEGKSYIFMVASSSADQASKTIPTEIWLAGIDPEAPFYRQLSDATPRVRKDPEVFITNDGPMIYYLAFLTPLTSAIYRCETGL
ncbi:hypothetical protein [Gloeobacter morelensis]|uniref:Uncharacterized protein n=1 Tax=Gloeobacter morelensis MG652769 TaxID=2781736 RepID=A0ABY3PGU7_9CYAN|nr:hypothetical protein [Gloeobacter morelensis]UFP92763.1 hypothetical protein ISF26_13075 [Gloeobacter morelensis MG652769]